MQRMLTKAEESASQEIDVRREDQDKINAFSRLNRREGSLDSDLKVKQKEKEDLEELSSELELADEDELVPYKLGDSFISLPLETVQSLLTQESSRLDLEVEELEGKLDGVREEMEELKVTLYARFGKTINLG